MSSLAEIFSEPWAIFQSPRDSKVIKKDFGFQWDRQRKNFWTLGYKQSGGNIARLNGDEKVAETAGATRNVILTNFGSICRNLGDISESQRL